MRQPRLDANHATLQLLNLRMGPGAAILPPEVSQIHMDFATKTQNGHMGAKYVSLWWAGLARVARHQTNGFSSNLYVTENSGRNTSPV